MECKSFISIVLVKSFAGDGFESLDIRIPYEE